MNRPADPVRAAEGDTNEEIAAQLGRAPSTGEQKLRLIRDAWEKQVTP
jgi:hypothetical protein